MLLLVVAIPSVSEAQFMRLGPFDVFANTGLDAIYSTNVEGERGDKKEGEKDREDYYLLYTFDMSLVGITTKASELTLDTGLRVEKHFVRDDLDNVSDPFGHALLNYRTDLGRFDLGTEIDFRRESTVEEEGSTRLYIPGQKKSRAVQDTRSFSQTVEWEWDPLRWNAGYSYRERRFADEEFKPGDENEDTIDFGAYWDVIQWGGQPRLETFYTLNRTRTELVNRPEGVQSGDWLTTEAIGVSLQIITAPDFRYTAAYKRDDQGGWRPTHTFSLSDEWDLSPTMQFDYSMQYVLDDEAREGDVQFVYTLGLEHEIGQTLRHGIRATREPVDTFGSTVDTDSTVVSYKITKDDLFFANFSFNGGVTYEKNKPQGPEATPEEEIWRYTVMLSHETAVSRRLSRRFAYDYRYETSTLDDPLEEHRVTLGFIFTF